MFNKYFLKERLKKKLEKKNGETRDWIIQHPRAQRTISLAISHHLRMDMVSENLKILFIEPKLIKVQKGDPRSYPLVSSASLARNLLWEVEAMLLFTPLSTPQHHPPVTLRSRHHRKTCSVLGPPPAHRSGMWLRLANTSPLILSSDWPKVEHVTHTVARTLFPVQGAHVWFLLRELDLTCCS